jgi:hypothetical protein
MKQFLAVVLSLGLLLQGVAPAFAGKSYSSGRSYSSGSSSSGRSFGSSSKPSGGSSFKPSGGSKSYSSGGSSKPSGSSYSSGSKSYSSGGSSKPSGSSYSSGSSKPSGSSYSSGSNKPSGSSYSSGSKSYSSGGSSKPSTPVAPNNSSKYSSGGSSNPPVAVDNGGGNSRKPSGSSFNSGLSSAGRKQESQTRYEASTAPKSTYTSKGSDGKTVQQNIKPDSPQVQTVRRSVTHERYVTYDNRANTFYGGYYGSPMYYHDPFSPFLMGWIMSDALNSQQRALWMYHHQSDMDSARYQAMLAKDAKLQAEIDALKAKNLTPDPSYVPPQMAENPDLMFNKDFVDASYNPVAVVENDAVNEGGSGGMWIVIVLIILVLGGVVVYYLFVKEY